MRTPLSAHNGGYISFLPSSQFQDIKMDKISTMDRKEEKLTATFTVYRKSAAISRSINYQYKQMEYN